MNCTMIIRFAGSGQAHRKGDQFHDLFGARALLATLTLLSGLSTTPVGAILFIFVSALGILLVLHRYCRAKSHDPNSTPRFIRRPPAPPSEESLKRVGYWWSPEEPTLPHPRDYVDTAWDAGERQRVIAYLSRCNYLNAWCGFSWCRFGCSNYDDMGTCDLTDGTWLFPEGLVHYVRHHAVKPPQDFLEHMQQGGFVSLNSLRVAFLNSLRASLSHTQNEQVEPLCRYAQRVRSAVPIRDSS